MADKEIVDEGREKFSSRLGFILISAGCAIGLGNIWRFPYITGEYGGAAFVLLILFFLVVLGVPLLVMEFAMGRASYRSLARSYEALEPQEVASLQVAWFGWLLSAHDVLYRGMRLDHCLLCEGGNGHV